jgi:hypothetical protein
VPFPNRAILPFQISTLYLLLRVTLSIVTHTPSKETLGEAFGLKMEDMLWRYIVKESSMFVSARRSPPSLGLRTTNADPFPLAGTISGGRRTSWRIGGCFSKLLASSRPSGTTPMRPRHPSSSRTADLPTAPPNAASRR